MSRSESLGELHGEVRSATSESYGPRGEMRAAILTSVQNSGNRSLAGPCYDNWLTQRRFRSETGLETTRTFSRLRLRSSTMASFRLELDKPNNIVLVVVTEDDDSDHDYQFDFDPNTGRWEFAERDLLERDFGEEWVEEFEEAVEGMINEAVGK